MGRTISLAVFNQKGEIAGYTRIDFEDLPKVMHDRWHFDAKGYVRSGHKGSPMHRRLMNAPAGVQVDHANRCKYDNRRSINLRLCSNAQNQMNVGCSRRNTSGYKGVSWHKRLAKFQTRIMMEGRAVHLGYFVDKRDAAAAYDIAATNLHGAFAVLNFPA
jgi:hypothetical protein